MRHGSLKALRGRTKALERATRFANRGLWISAEEVEAVKTKLHQKLGLSATARIGSDRNAGFFHTRKANHSTGREKLQKFMEAIRSGGSVIAPGIDQF